MTNEELKDLFIELLQEELYRTGTVGDPREAVLAKLESGHIFVGQWRTDVENAPRNTDLLLSCGGVVASGFRSEWLGWRTTEGNPRVDPDAYAELPPPPKAKP